jgi:hypothetical protein
VFDGLEHSSYKVAYPIHLDCPWHEAPAPIEALPQFDSETSLSTIWKEAERRLGGADALDLSRELVQSVECPDCKTSRDIFRPAENVSESDVRCPKCEAECVPNFLHSIGRGSQLLAKKVREIGLPRWDIIYARRGANAVGLEIAGDRPAEFPAAVEERRK